VEGWLLKPDGLYDTWEPGVDEDWFEEGDWEWRLKGSHKGWSFRRVQY
jgi:hypothetical protein